MEDTDLKELLERLKVGLIFALIIGIIFILMIVKKFGAEESSVISKINKEEDLLILVVQNKCKECNEVKQILKENNVEYVILNLNNEKYYKTILKKLELTENDVKVPSLIYVVDKKAYSTLVDVDKKHVKEYLENIMG